MTSEIQVYTKVRCQFCQGSGQLDIIKKNTNLGARINCYHCDGDGYSEQWLDLAALVTLLVKQEKI